MSPDAYYLVTSGEVRKRANAYRKTLLRLRDDLWDVVKSVGATKGAIDDSRIKLRGIVFPGSPPEGWTKPNRAKLSRPKPTKANAEILKHFTPTSTYTCTRHPELATFFDWLGCPTGYEYKTGTSEGWTSIGGWSPGLFWYSATGPILLVVADVAAARREAVAEGRTVEDGVLSWKPPAGCKKILREEWELMRAKNEK